MILRIPNIVQGYILKRPSKVIKSPYVADIILQKDGDDSSEKLAHCPSLGCCGLSEQGSTVWMTSIPLKKNEISHEKCAYRVCFSSFTDPRRKHSTTIGIYPKYAENIVEEALKKNVLSVLKNVKSFKRECKVHMDGIEEDSRFDFVGVDENDRKFIMEIKNVPLADYEDISNADKKKFKVEYSLERDFNSKVAYFPDGYRRKGVESISPRALKHLRTLTKIVVDQKEKTRCILCFVIQRTDVNRFAPSVIDPEYRRSFYEAKSAGVEIITLVIDWRIVTDNDGMTSAEAYFIRDDLPVTDEFDIFTPPTPTNSSSTSLSSNLSKIDTKTSAKIEAKVILEANDSKNISSELDSIVLTLDVKGKRKRKLSNQ